MRSVTQGAGRRHPRQRSAKSESGQDARTGGATQSAGSAQPSASAKPLTIKARRDAEPTRGKSHAENMRRSAPEERASTAAHEWQGVWPDNRSRPQNGFPTSGAAVHGHVAVHGEQAQLMATAEALPMRGLPRPSPFSGMPEGLPRFVPYAPIPA